jgi:hypothetical protein
MTRIVAVVIGALGLSQVDVAAELYAALLGERYHGVPAALMVVKDTAVAMPTLLGSASEWLAQFDQVPSELRRAASQPSPTKRRRLDGAAFPSGTSVMSAQAIEKVFTSPTPRENWSAFRAEFHARGWLAFSEGLVTRDRLNALVYYEGRCGGLCGEGGYVWLRRDTVSSPWRIARKIVSWMS